MRDFLKSHRKQHFLALLSIAALAIHFFWPEMEAISLAITGIICSECA